MQESVMIIVPMAHIIIRAPKRVKYANQIVQHVKTLHFASPVSVIYIYIWENVTWIVQ